MKRRVMLLVFCFVSFVFSTSAFAAWDSCKVMRIGVSGPNTTVLRVNNCDNSANNKKFFAITDQVDRSMATILTARSLGVKLRIAGDFANASTDGTIFGAIYTINLEE